jgi:hypothetical protein
VEVIGGPETYMAACRRCFHSSVAKPASPRIPLKQLSASQNGCHSPPKKALFAAPEESAGAL